ncbi:hypothetical protein LRC484719_53760 [Mycobacterium riyadhense]
MPNIMRRLDAECTCLNGHEWASAGQGRLMFEALGNGFAAVEDPNAANHLHQLCPDPIDTRLRK